ncbi:MAG: nucleotide exchange factor GrpE [Bryobacteraceae bacterium]|nr:nucleotide exchange factor GrpE [Bryobacteraceae bacterium]
MEENVQSTIVETQVSTELPVETTDSEYTELKQQKAELQERVLRLQAEFENFRKRTERERMEFAEYAGEMTIRALLPILDDFERALKAAGGAENELMRGIELIYTRLLEALRKQGLDPVSVDGAQFDPHQHEAIGSIESADHEEGSIVQEYQRGYKFKGRLLRPAMVQVAVKQ